MEEEDWGKVKVRSGQDEDIVRPVKLTFGPSSFAEKKIVKLQLNLKFFFVKLKINF